MPAAAARFCINAGDDTKGLVRTGITEDVEIVSVPGELGSFELAFWRQEV